MRTELVEQIGASLGVHSQPATVLLPAADGKTRAGLPVGLQLVGKPHGDAELFSVASYLEPLFGWDPLDRIRD